MAAVTICSDFGAQKNRTPTYQIEFGEIDGTSKEKQSLKSYSGGCVAAATVNTGLIY